ncbi:MAG: Fic family protein [Candidatus Kapabacteria bacterium]|nr:Fic family protein [Candidatus Kapabacteria bacterium]
MPKRIPSDAIDTLVGIIAERDRGATLEDIAPLVADVPRRTLQHRLSVLVSQQRIVRVGKGRATRYHQVPTLTLREQAERYRADEPASNISATLRLTPQGKEVQQLVRLPLIARTPVAYNPDFLGEYRPNETFYLPSAIRGELLECGRSLDSVRPAGTYIKTMYNRLLIDLSWNSSRLEGNTYSLLETEYLLTQGRIPEGANLHDIQMILNHKTAIDMLVEQQEDIDLNRYTILSLHNVLSDNLLADSDAQGRLRMRPVGIAGTVYLPLEVPQLIDEYFGAILDTAGAIKDPFEQSFFMMVHLPYLQPFEDVNKRVSRLAANIPFIRENLSPLSFVDVPIAEYIEGLLGVYELNRIELLRDVFVWGYKRSCLRYSAMRRTLGEPDPFRLHHRSALYETIAEIVRSRMNRSLAVTFIRNKAAESVPESERARFIEVVETEIMNLHDANIARFRLRPSEFQAWKDGWR